jgi:alkyldihydroxyacetonephosphate synthase
MSETATLSRRRKLRFYGWGYADDLLSADEEARVRGSVRRFGTAAPVETPAPRESDFALPPPRVAVPAAIEPLVSTTPYDRLTHSFGKSFADIVRMFMRDVPHPPDLVAFPKSEDDVAAILDWASRANVAAIPFGGGSSVAGGVEPDVGDGYAGTVSIDLQYLHKVLEVDRTSRAARIQAGALGPELEDQLRPHGLTLRHFPQSLSTRRSAAGSPRAAADTTPRSTRTSTTSWNPPEPSPPPACSRRAACRDRGPDRRRIG